MFVEHFCIDFNFILSFQFFDEYDKRNFETRSKFTKCCVKDPVDVFLSHHEQNNIWLFVNHNVQSIRFIRERDPNWFVGTDKQDYLSCEFKKKIEYSKKKKFYLQGKKSNRSKEYWKSLEICTSFVRSLIEPASFLIQDLFRDESYSKELCSRGPRRFFNFEFLPENWRRETRRRLNCGSLDF